MENERNVDNLLGIVQAVGRAERLLPLTLGAVRRLADWLRDRLVKPALPAVPGFAAVADTVSRRCRRGPQLSRIGI